MKLIIASLEEFEYLVLKLNMVAQQPIKTALSYVAPVFASDRRVLAPGADILLEAIEPYDPNLTASLMTAEQWKKLGDAFHKWVFKPDVLEDETFIDDDIVEDAMNTAVHPSREFSEDVISSLDLAEKSKRR